MKQLDSRQATRTFIVGAVVTLAGLVPLGVLLYAIGSTGDISGVLQEAGWFGTACITAMLVCGLFFLRAGLRRERSGLAAKRVMAGITALFVLAFVFFEWVPMARRDNSVDPEQLLEESRSTLKVVDSELDRIKSESDAIAPAEGL